MGSCPPCCSPFLHWLTIMQSFCEPGSHLVQLKRHGNPSRAIENQIDPNEKTYYPEPRDRPLRQEQHAHDCRDHPVCCPPTPARQITYPHGSEELIKASDEEEHRHDQGYCLGTDDRFEHHERASYSEHKRHE